MILQFTFQNHRSFRDETTISFVSTSRRDEPSHRILSRHAKYGALPVVGLWGGNASGKSNVIQALLGMRAAVRDSHRRWEATEPPRWDPWHADRSENAPAASYAVDLVVGETRYRYAFTLHNKGFLAESLTSWSGHRQSLVFEREGLGKDATWSFGSSFKGPRERLREQTRANSLFLSVGAQENHPVLLDVYGALTTGVRVEREIQPRGFPVFPPDHPILQPTYAERLNALVRLADVGAAGIQTEPDLPPKLRIGDGMSAEDKQLIDKFLERFGEKSDASPLLRMRLKHHDGWSPEPHQESRGTNVLLQRLSDILPALDAGQLLVVDELDTSLHPDLARQLLRLFTTAETNTRGAQLLFTSHHRELLHELRTDEILLVDKTRDGVSSIAAASDFTGVRSGPDVRRMQARLGGVPVLGDFAAMLETKRRQTTQDSEAAAKHVTAGEPD